MHPTHVAPQCVIVLCLILSGSASAAAQTFSVTDQYRHTGVMTNASRCNQTYITDTEDANGSDSFDSEITAQHGCDSAFAFAYATQQSQIGSDSLVANGQAISTAVGPQTGVTHAISSSTYDIDFNLPGVRLFQLTGEITAADGNPSFGVYAQIKLIGPGNQNIFWHIVNPGPGGATNTQSVTECRKLAPGQYTLLASCAVGIDNVVPPDLHGESSFDVSADIGVLGDIDADGDTDIGDIDDFTEALLGTPLDPEVLLRADLNCDAAVDGADIQHFIDAITG